MRRTSLKWRQMIVASRASVDIGVLFQNISYDEIVLNTLLSMFFHFHFFSQHNLYRNYHGRPLSRALWPTVAVNIPSKISISKEREKRWLTSLLWKFHFFFQEHFCFFASRFQQPLIKEGIKCRPCVHVCHCEHTAQACALWMMKSHQVSCNRELLILSNQPLCLDGVCVRACLKAAWGRVLGSKYALWFFLLLSSCYFFLIDWLINCLVYKISENEEKHTLSNIFSSCFFNLSNQ